MRIFVSSTVLFLLVTPLLSQQQYFANSQDLTLEEIQGFSLEELMNITIVSSTGTAQKISDAPSIATVITAKQIERSSARTYYEVLQMVPGLNIYISNLQNSKQSIDIRGIKTNFNSQVLILMNGVRINQLHDGSAALDYFPASAIKRLEVIRGPGSAVYGADAFSGTINIVTKDAQYLKDHSQVGLRYGSFNRVEAFGNYGEVFDNGVEMGLNLSYTSSDEDDRRTVNSDSQTTFDGIFGTSASLAPSYFDKEYEVFNMNANFKYENWSLDLWGRVSDNVGTGAGVANALDHNGYTEDTQFLAELNHDSKPFKDIKWNNKLTYVYIDNYSQLNLFPAGAVLPIGDDGNFFTPGGGFVLFSDGARGNPNTIENTYAYESTFNISTFKDNNLRLSAGYSYADYKVKEEKNFGPGVINGTEGIVNGALTSVTGTSYVFSPDKTRKIFFLSLQDEYKISEDWQLTAGLRYDKYSDFGDTLNPRLGLVWNISEKLTTKLLYGRAFRAPSFLELYAQNNPVAVGNSDLDAETIDMLELGFNYQTSKDLQTSMNFYWYIANDLIEGVPSNIGIEFNNIGEQDGAGVELEASYQATSNLLLSADYAYRWTENKKTGEAVAGVPKHIGHASFDWAFIKNFYLSSEIFMFADTPREVGDARNKISSYRIVNASIGYKLNKNIEASVAARNLFDKKYYSPSSRDPINDYPMEGLNVFAELRYRF